MYLYHALQDVKDVWLSKTLWRTGSIERPNHYHVMYLGVISVYLLNSKHVLLRIYKILYFFNKSFRNWLYLYCLIAVTTKSMTVFVLWSLARGKLFGFLEKFSFIESIFFKSLKFPATFINFEGQIRNLDLHALQAYMHTYALTCLDIMDCGRALLDGNTERTQERKVFRI